MNDLALSLFDPTVGYVQASEHWRVVRDGNELGIRLFMDHYSCKRPMDKLLGGNKARRMPLGGAQ